MRAVHLHELVTRSASDSEILNINNIFNLRGEEIGMNFAHEIISTKNPPVILNLPAETVSNYPDIPQQELPERISANSSSRTAQIFDNLSSPSRSVTPTPANLKDIVPIIHDNITPVNTDSMT